MPTIVGNILADIHNFFEKMFTKIKMIPHEIFQKCNDLYPFFVEIKKDLESGIARTLASNLPGGEAVRQDVLIAVNAALTALGYVDGELQDKYNQYIEESKKETEATNRALLIKSLSLTTAHLDNNEQHESAYDTAAQTVVFNHIA